ncbi:MAG: AMP-binding protein [Chloroflexi bacterium]|nr:AMP-binding protein [Chloroflexota bacterium]
MAEDAPAWFPSTHDIARSRLAALATGLGGGSSTQHALDALRKRAAADPAWFWSQMAEELALPWDTPPNGGLDLARGAPFAQFFPDASLNLSTAAIDRWVDAGRSDATAIIWEGDEGGTTEITYAELAREVALAHGALAKLGIREGDRVALFMPLIPECAVAMLACARLGAIFTPIYSGFGASSVATRLVDSGARLLVTVDSASRRGRPVPLKAIADEAAAESPSVERMLVVRRLGEAAGVVPWDPSRDVWWHEALQGASRAAPSRARTAACDPYMLIYTSGTTGRPKATRHVHAGFPVKSATDMVLCFDVQQGDRVLWYSDPGWMMAPWLIQGTLLLGATAVLFDGTPDWPGPGRLWEIVDRHQVTVLGIAPTAIRALMRHGENAPRAANLSSLRALGSSGEPWTPEAWWWYFREIGRSRCPIINYTGGTEVAGGILACTTIEPQYPCAFTGPIPGMDASVVDGSGNSVTGTVGELVVRAPWVGMTSSFWGGPGDGHDGHDASRQREADDRYLDTYWRRPGLDGMWVHGDWARVDETGAWYLLGRSDDTIKVAGKRLGPTEVEGAATAHPDVSEAAACGIPDAIKGESLAVVVVPTDRGAADDKKRRSALAEEVAGAIALALGKSLRPGLVVVVPDLPKTRSGKVMRRVIRAVLSGDPDLGDLSGLDQTGPIDRLREAMGQFNLEHDRAEAPSAR